MARVLLMRPLEDAIPMEKYLSSKGVSCCLYPLFKPHFFPISPLKNPQALIITSKNAIRSLEKYEELKEIPLYAVGDKTAELAKQKGFLNVSTGSGTGEELIKLIIEKTQRNAGILWHLGGEKKKGNIVESLKKAGFQAEEQIVYSIEDATDFPLPLYKELENHAISHVTFCSPRTTAIFLDLLKQKKLEKITPYMTCLCLSQEVAEKASALSWEKIWISPRPQVIDLMGYFDEKRQ